jgi:hypothetical protein
MQSKQVSSNKLHRSRKLKCTQTHKEKELQSIQDSSVFQPSLILVRTRRRETSVDTPQLILHTVYGTKQLELSRNSTWTFGRSKTNTVCLKDPMSSRHHAKLEIVQDRHYYFVDLNSRNGSLINGQRVTQPTLLKHGDYISIGNTFLLFQHRVVTLSGIPFPNLSKQVLMLQASAVQGKIWQEILLSQKASVVWEGSSSELKNRIVLNATSNTLPGLLLIDQKAYRVKLYEFCNWCRQTYPQLKIFLTDSLRQQIPDRERHSAIQQGCLNLFPAFAKSNLVNNAASVTIQVNEVLQAIGISPIQPNQLLPTLKRLEDLMEQGASFSPLFDDEIDSEHDIPTALSAHVPSQKRLDKNKA